MKKTLPPLWAGLVNVIAYFYGIGTATYAYTTETGLQAGYGFIVSWIYLPFIFLIVMAITAGVISALFYRIENTELRISSMLIALLVYLVLCGLPSLIVIFFAFLVFAVTYKKSQKDLTDNADLKKFMEQ